MEQTRVIQGTEELARGELDNVTLDGGGVALDQAGGRHLLYGCYTSPMLRLPAFDRLSVSWNADVPKGTVVEVQARALVRGTWRAWCSFGRWSPWLLRHGTFRQPGEEPYVQGDQMMLPDQPGAAVQVRAFLYTEDEKVSPTLRLLAVSARPVAPQPGKSRPLFRELRVPAYSLARRDPAFGPGMAGPACLAGLMNRWGQDVLPEELAHMCFDHEGPGCENLTFLAAAAGGLGFSSWQCWLDLPGLREEIRAGNGVMAAVKPGVLPLPAPPKPEEAAPAPAEPAEASAAPEPAPETEPDPAAPPENAPEPEAMPEATPTVPAKLVPEAPPQGPCAQPEEATHRVAVRGFAPGPDGGVLVLLNDPAAPDDRAAETQVPLADFLRAWDGRCLVLCHKDRRGGKSAPQRIGCQMTAVACELPTAPDLPGDSLWLLTHGGKPCPMPDAGSPYTLAYTCPEDTVYATTAHKRFHFDAALRDGRVCLPAGLEDRVTVYCIDCFGQMRVAEHLFL